MVMPSILRAPRASGKVGSFAGAESAAYGRGRSIAAGVIS